MWLSKGERQETGGETGSEGKCPGERKRVRKGGEETDRSGTGLGTCEELDSTKQGGQGGSVSEEKMIS